MDRLNNTTIIKDMVKNAKLTDRLEKGLQQLSVTVEEMTVDDKEEWEMWHLLFDLLLMSVGMGVVLMCILQVGKEADTHLEEMERSKDRWISVRTYTTGF